MKQFFDKRIIKLFRCPVDRNHPLARTNNGFMCPSCQRKFVSRFVNEIEIPNFLIHKTSWVQGYRGLTSKLIGIFQKESPVDQYSGSDSWILDIGCGENARGNINLDCYVPEKIPQNLILANAEHLPFKNKSIDTILSYYNIEHLIDPAEFILEAKNIAKNKVEIVTDNSEWFGDILFRIIGSGRIFHDEHVYKWSKEYMANLLRRLGIKQAQVSVQNLSSTPVIKLLSTLGRIPRIGYFFYRDLKIEIQN